MAASTRLQVPYDKWFVDFGDGRKR